MASLSAPVFERHLGGGHYEGYCEWHLTDADLTAAATTEAVSLDDFPADARPLLSMFNIGEYFDTGGTVTDVDLEIGDSGDPNGLGTITNIFDTVGLGDWTVQAGDGVESKYGSTDPGTAYSPEALFTATGDNVDQLTNGRVAIRIYFERYSPM